MIFKALRVFTHYFLAFSLRWLWIFHPRVNFSVRPKKMSALSMPKD